MNTPDKRGPSSEEVEHRIRNRLIQYLESVAYFNEDRAPWDLHEQLEQWQDWVPLERPLGSDVFPDPVYNLDERSALLAVDVAWEAMCDATPARIRD